MAKDVVRIEGLKELDRALGGLPKAVAKRVAREILRDAAEPMARQARLNAPRDEYHLYESIDVSSKLSRRQAAQHRSEADPAFTEMFVGTADPAGVQQEFGNENHPAQPFFRPAWDAEKTPTLNRITNSLWFYISKAANRLARRAGKSK